MAKKNPSTTYTQTVRQAVQDVAQPGDQVNPSSIAETAERLRRAASGSFKPMEQVSQEVRDYYTSLYNRVANKRTTKPIVARYTRAALSRAAREELQKKIESSVALIKLNREVAVAETMRRFVGWASSVPPDGAATAGETKRIVKSLKQLPYIERRVIIDQGHKLVASLENVVSVEAGAIAAIWHSHAHQAGYDFRVEHAAREGKIYLIRDSWADKQGLVKPINGYTDDQEMPASLVNCRCTYQYLFNLKDLPSAMLTQKAKDILAGKRAPTQADGNVL